MYKENLVWAFESLDLGGHGPLLSKNVYSILSRERGEGGGEGGRGILWKIFQIS